MASIEVLLIKPVDGLGAEGEQVRVRAGFARNYLLPQGIALPVNRSNTKYVEALKKAREIREARDLEEALPLYRMLHPLLRWDSKTEFVQAIKLSMDMAGRYGGPCRAPRQPLLPEQEASVRKATQVALEAGAH